MFSRDRLIRAHLRTRFVVTLKSGEAFDGLLIDADASTLILADAWLIEQAGRHSVDGQLFVARADVAYMQLAVVSGVISA